MKEFVIIGGGVVGMLVARQLVEAGAEVTVIEKGQCGTESSWAGGGIVSPLYPWRYSEAVTALSRWAQSLYPALCEDLIDKTGIDPELVKTGLLMLDAGDEQQALDWSVEVSSQMTRVEKQEIYRMEPELAERFSSGLWMPEISNIRNPRLGKALKKYLEKSGRVTLLENAEVVSVNCQDEKVVSVTVVSGRRRQDIAGHDFIVTAGAWSSGILPEKARLPEIHPVKGQMILYQPEKKLISSIVLTEGRYIIPRKDGLLLVGSTLEHTGFEKVLTNEAKASLKASAVSLLPALSGTEVAGHWAGLRPGTPSGIPYIGQCRPYENLHINAGHYRNGLVLAPASAVLLADQLLGRPCLIDPVPYQLDQKH